MMGRFANAAADGRFVHDIFAAHLAAALFASLHLEFHRLHEADSGVFGTLQQIVNLQCGVRTTVMRASSRACRKKGMLSAT